jgi:hypothetical protein
LSLADTVGDRAADNQSLAISGFDVTADGSRAILVRDELAVSRKQINVILNWQEELKQPLRSG